MKRTFTGRHMAFTLVAFFGVVAAVNFTMAGYARSSFTGVVVENSYVASQEFNGWLDAAEAQKALGWSASTSVRPDGRLAVELSGVPAGAKVTALARHPFGREVETPLSFTRSGQQAISSRPLGAGRWIVRLEITSGEQVWRHEEEVRA